MTDIRVQFPAHFSEKWRLFLWEDSTGSECTALYTSTLHVFVVKYFSIQASTKF